VSRFFQPPNPWPEQAAPANPPPWTGRPQGPPLGVVVRDLLLARSDQATIYVDYLDAYPEGFELEIRASTSVGYGKLAREGDGSGPDPFGRHWPMAGERRDVLPPQLLRVGVQYADGRAATSISGHDRPVGGPAMRCLGGGGRGGAAESCFRQGYWISPLPPPGPLAVLCEWPAVKIAVTRQEIDAQMILDAAETARTMFGDGQHVSRDGHAWRLGTSTEAAWINDGISPVRSIAYAIPPVFDCYCTVELPRSRDPAELDQHEQAMIALLSEHAPEQSWWLGYLDTGASDVVFPYAPRTTIYSGYPYVLIQAGPRQAAGWRDRGFSWRLPELIFPADRSWLLSTMWDDDWTCVGGPKQLVEDFLHHTTLGPRARRVTLGEDPTPPGQRAN
jgi:hypothetical protein